jgi:putative endonuclease
MSETSRPVDAERSTRRARGNRAEDAAAQHVRAAGWRLLARNWHDRFGELDIVAEQNGVIAFIEVKARRHNRYGDGLTAVTWRKRRRMIHAARNFLARGRWPLETPCRFDVIVAALGPHDTCSIETWLQGAFDTSGA